MDTTEAVMTDKQFKQLMEKLEKIEQLLSRQTYPVPVPYPVYQPVPLQPSIPYAPWVQPYTTCGGQSIGKITS